jgi:drug/metabolite transporter (DMT)-like permease
VAVLIGLAAAAGFGSGDFLGGTASRRSPTAAVLVLSQACALALAVVYALAVAGVLSGRAIGFGAAAGALNAVGLACLYRGLATGRMGVVAPATAMGAALIPIVWGLAIGERPSDVALAGVGLVVVAGGMIGRERDLDGGNTARALGWAMASATAFGVAFIFFAETGADSGFWPVLTGRIAAVVVVVVAVAIIGGPWLPAPRVDQWRSAGAGFLDVTATALLLVALRRDLITIVAPIVALAPAITVVLAWFFLREPIGRVQRIGIVVALGGLMLIARG